MITYIATNTLNGKFYIGSTRTRLDDRRKSHLKSELNYPFQNALRKNPEAFEWDVFEDDSEDRVLEQALLDTWFGFEQCYNLSSRATGWGPEHVKRGNKHPMFGKESPNKGTSWWVDAHDNEMMSVECPGKGWRGGRSKQHAAKTSNTLIGRYVGEKHPLSKLSNKQRKEIQSRGVLGFGGNVSELAKEFGVTGRQIRNIINTSSPC